MLIAQSSANPNAPHRLEARLLGGLVLCYNGHPVPHSAFRRRKSLQLLLRLLVSPTHQVALDALLEQLWPEQDPRLSTANLRSVLSAVRSALCAGAAPNPVVRLDPALALDPALDLVLDIDRFALVAGQGLAEGDPDALRRALALYAGPLLPDLPYEEWVLDRRAALARLYRQVVLALAGEGEPAVEERLRALLAEDPTDEPVGQALMRLLGARDRMAEALRVHRVLVSALQEELGVDPGAETTALYAALLATPAAPPSPTPAPPRHNLPAALSSFIGRSWEQAELRHLLDRTRLLTLTGPGGCGKSRLAVAVALARLTAFPDGVRLVELAPVDRATAVLPATAHALGLREEPDRSLLAILVAHLATGNTLVLLDNCEHVLGACAALADHLLRRCPGLRILATSRERLGLTGESVWPVPPLSLPPEEAGVPLAQLARAEAVQLFVERVRGVRPGFALSAENAPAVGRICRRLDGIPLALELAAGRAGVLALAQLADRLDQRFLLLTGGSRTALPRQRTLRAGIDWSYELLSAPERLLLGRLAVFVGGWPLAAAEAVCIGGDIEVPAVLDLLDGLVSKSLVQVEGMNGGPTRYRLLETMRHYAWERLEEAGEAHLLRGRHLQWCLALAEEAEPELRGAEQGWWLACLEREHDNLRAALRWAGEHGDAEDGLRMAGTLARFWHIRGHFSEGRQWLDSVLATGAQGCSSARAKALNGAGLLAQRQGDFGRAWTLHQESLALWRTMGDKKAIAASLANLGMVASWQGDYRLAQTMHQKGLALYRRLGDRLGVAHSLNNLGLDVYDQGDYARAAVLLGESLALKRELGDKRGVAASLNNLGLVAHRQGDYAQATELLKESLALERELGHQHGIAASLNCLGYVASDQGDFAKAESLHQESLTLGRALGDKRGVAASLNNLGLAAYRQGDFTRAATLLEEGLLLSHGLNARDLVVEALEGVAWVAMACEQPGRAARLGGAAMALREALGMPRTPVRRAEHDQMLQAGRAALGEEGLAMAWGDGQTLAPEQAVTLALSGQPDPGTVATG